MDVKIGKVTLPIQTSEIWHKINFGDPRKCYHQYLQQRELHLEIFSGGKTDITEHGYDKWYSLTRLSPFGKEAKRILDLGSNGLSDMFLLHFCPTIETIVAIDGDKEALETYSKYLDKRIKLIYHDFYEQGFPIVELGFDTPKEFDIVLQIDFAEHLPDTLWEAITYWALTKLKINGKMFLYTPAFPFASEQMEHISVKSIGYYSDYFCDRVNMPLNVKFSVLKRRIFIVIEKKD